MDKSKNSDDVISHNELDADIAIIGIGCQYPGADNTKQLWENILTRKREFRRLRDERLPVAEYYDPDPKAEDKLYIKQSAYIDNFEFDWIKRRIPKATIEATDIVQWLTLEVAERAIHDAGYDKDSIPKDKTGVVLGNSLTGEQSRANTMRLRWPFVEKTLLRSAKAQNLPQEQAYQLAAQMRDAFKSVFCEVNEDYLQGGLANTVAGRVTNYFDLHGGGYNVDGACASSLIAICTAADHLRNNNWDVALAGGVDISLDTFELIGFAKTSALTPDDMTVYDEKGNGFLPGEGCGFVVLKRLKDAIRDGDEIYSVLKGWGISSDGKGGITAPSNKGQSTALRRAYEMAKYSPGTLDFIEGHGTGTRVGDRIELEGIGLTMEAFGEAKPRNVGMTSFKSIVGHTKAAAGVGAFIKTVIALNRRVQPPTANCKNANPVFEDKASTLYPTLQGVQFPANKIMRAGVSAMGFGGINSHCTLESYITPPSSKFLPSLDERLLLSSDQDTEVFVFGADNIAELIAQLQAESVISREISLSELVDYAQELTKRIQGQKLIKAAFVARYPEELADNMLVLVNQLTTHPLASGQSWQDKEQNIWVSNHVITNKVGFIFPGQGSQQFNAAKVLIERYQWAQELLAVADQVCTLEFGQSLSHYLYDKANFIVTKIEKKTKESEITDTQIAQPAIVFTSLLYAKYLNQLGIKPHTVAGHSLGELVAFSQAGLLTDEELIRLSVLRGKVMKAAGNGRGTMAALFTDAQTATNILQKVSGYVVIANKNSPKQTVISGEIEAIDEALIIAKQHRVSGRKINVSAAFHSEHMQTAADNFITQANISGINQLNQAALFSSTNGEFISKTSNIVQHFAQQITKQVDYIQLINNLAEQVDWLIEVGPGQVLTNLSQQIQPNLSILPVAATANDDRNLNQVLAQYFTISGEVNWQGVYENRLVRSFVPAHKKNFIVNPCENEMSITADYAETVTSTENIQAPTSISIQSNKQSQYVENTHNTTQQNLLNLVAARTGFPVEHIGLQSRLLDDLNLDSIKAGELVASFTQELQLSGQISATDFVNSSLQQLLDAVNELQNKTNTPTTLNTEIIQTIPNVDQEVASTLKALVAERTGFPAESISDNLRLLDDLNLDSIKAGELVASFIKVFGNEQQIVPSDYVNATLAELKEAVLGNNALTNEQQETKNSQQDNNTSAADALTTIKQMVAERTGFPVISIPDEARLLDDLNLDSIKAGELIASFMKEYDASGQVAANDLVNATLQEIVEQVIDVTPVESSSSNSPSLAVISKPNNYLEQLKAMVAERTGFPTESITHDARLLDDLNLDSIKAGELIASFMKEHNANGQVAANDLVNATLQEIVEAISGDLPNSGAKQPLATENLAIAQPSQPLMTTALAQLKDLVAERTGFPVESIDDEAKLLDDLNLDSIKAGELIASFSKMLASEKQIDSSALANQGLREIVEAVLDVTTPLTEYVPAGLEQPEIIDNTESHSRQTIQTFLLTAISERTGFPAESIEVEARLLDDLNLDSIKAGELITSLAKTFNVNGQLDQNNLVNATLTELMDAVSQQITPQNITTKETIKPVGNYLDHGGKDYLLEETEADNFIINYLPSPKKGNTEFNWHQQQVLLVHDSEQLNTISELKQQLTAQGSQVHVQSFSSTNSVKKIDTVICFIPTEQQITTNYEQQLQRSVTRLQSVAAIANQYQPQHVVIAQFSGGRFGTDKVNGIPENFANAAFLRSWSLERKDTKLRVLDFSTSATAKNIVEALTYDLGIEEHFLAVGYDEQQTRLLPKAMLSDSSNYVDRDLHYNDDDVIVITGGAKGITAECGLKLAETVKGKFILLGSSPLPTDINHEIHQNIKRYQALGRHTEYLPCNLTDRQAVQQVIQQITEQHHKVSALIHGAGINIPRLVSQVSAEQAYKEIGPKLLGLRHLLDALAQQPLKIIVGITSIIGIAGMTGNAWYAFANESVDLVLRQYSAQRQCQAVSLGYTVWKEVGMGHRLGVVDNLENSGVGALSVKDGTHRFAQLFHYKASDQQVAIIGDLSGLITWQQLLNSGVNESYRRYLDQIEQNTQGIKVRTTLNTKRDPYLLDHNLNGTLLMPTVFGLEAMAQTVLKLVNRSDLKISIIEKISLELPITVPPGGETEIEIRAHIEVNSSQHTIVAVGIWTEQTGFNSAHFSAQFVLKNNISPLQITPFDDQQALTIQPKTDLYNKGGVLFQGPMFQRLGQVHQLNSTETQLSIHALPIEHLAEQAFANTGSELVLSDPFYRDVLLQSVQLSLAPEFVLPVGIEQIKIFDEQGFIEGKRLIHTKVKQRIKDDFICDVTVTNTSGKVIEQLINYRVRIMAKYRLSLSADDIAGRTHQDQDLVNHRLSEILKGLSLTQQTQLGIRYMPELHQLHKAQRQEKEVPLVQQLVQQVLPNVQAEMVKLNWTTQGKPFISTPEFTQYDISISHDDDFCLVTFGQGDQGCDIEQVKNRTQVEWLGLIGNKRQKILEELINNGDNTSIAGLRIWSAIEVIRKMNLAQDKQIQLVVSLPTASILKVTTETKTIFVLSTLVQLSQGGEKLISLNIDYKEKQQPMQTIHTQQQTSTQASTQASTQTQQQSDLVYDAGIDQMVFNYELQVGFRECGNLSRTVYYSSYLQWVGKVRELFMAEIAKDLVPQIASGDWGLVTNWGELNVFSEAECYDKIKARFRLGKVYGAVIPLHCDFYKVEANGELTELAHVMQETTWVKIIGHGQVVPAEFPPYFKQFLDKTTAKVEPIFNRHNELLDPGSATFKAKPIPGGIKPFYIGEFNTCFEDANLVGNIYYANYFIWQGRVRNNFLGEVIPDYLKGIGEQGELLTVRSRMDYLRDAMPFDHIHVEMSLKVLNTKGATLGYQFYRTKADGGLEKLSVGEQEVVWVLRDANGVPTTAALPEAFKDRVLNNNLLNTVA